ncbi:MAG: archaeal heat shock protein Hsp20 [Thermoplasmata archaeon]
MSWRRKRRDDWWSSWFLDEDFDDFFLDVEENFRRVQEQMNRLMRRMAKGDLPAPEEGGPFVYGFSLKVGPNGKPEIREFGNTKLGPGPGTRESAGEPLITAREPVTDVIRGEDEISVTFEMPGIEKDAIDLEVSDDYVTIEAKTEERTYRKKVDLPQAVDSEKAKATYHNGVLEIAIPLAKKKERKGKKIKVG